MPNRRRVQREGRDSHSTRATKPIAPERDSCQELNEAADELAAMIIEFYRQWKQL